MRNVVVVLRGGEQIAAQGEVTFDPVAATLTLRGEESDAFIRFNWPSVAYYAVSTLIATKEKTADA